MMNIHDDGWRVSMTRTAITVSTLAGSVSTRIPGSWTYRPSAPPVHGTVDIARDGVFTYSRTAMPTDEDDPPTVGTDCFGIVVVTDGGDVGEIVVRVTLSTSRTAPISDVSLTVVDGCTTVYRRDHRESSRCPSARRVGEQYNRPAGRTADDVYFGADSGEGTFHVFVSDGIRGTTSYSLSVLDGPLLW